MKRTGFKPKFPPRPAKQMDSYTVKPRAAAVAIHDGKARMVVPVPKFHYVRDERLRDMCRAMPCQHCGRSGADAGVTWAHSNQSIHGKSAAKKASDIYIAAMCFACHAELDQGRLWTKGERIEVWNAAHLKTVYTAVANNLWPSNIEPPTPRGLNASF